MSTTFQLLSSAFIFLTILFSSSRVSSLLAYDCTHENNNVTSVSLSGVTGCSIPVDSVKEESEIIQLLQSSSIVRLHVFQCKVQVLRTIYICGGMISYIKAVSGGLTQYLQKVTESECLSMFKDKEYSFWKGKTIHDLLLNSTTSSSMVLVGSLSTDGNCKGDSYTSGYSSYDDVVVQVSVDISLHDYYTDVVLENDLVLLRSGKSCVYKAGFCLDPDSGYTFWSTVSERQCPTTYDVLYEGPANKTYRVNPHGPADIIYTVNQGSMLFALSTIREINVCNFYGYQSEHPKLVIVPVKTREYPFAKRPIVSGNLDLFNYVNSKFVYHEKNTHRQMTALYLDLMHHKCRLEKELLYTQLSIGKLHPSEFAALYMKEEGYTAIVAGEVLYIIQCQAVDVKYRPEETCFQEFPVSYNGEPYFMSPHNRLLGVVGSPIPCSGILAPLYQMQGKWWSLSPRLVEAKAPHTLVASDTLTWEYQQPGKLASQGIYDQKNLEDMSRSIMYQIGQRAIVDTIVLGSDHPASVPRNHGISLDGFMSEDKIKSIFERVSAKVVSYVWWFGNISSSVIGAYLVLRFIKIIIDTILQGRILYDIFGMSWELVFSCWDSVTNCLVHRAQKRGKYSYHPDQPKDDEPVEPPPFDVEAPPPKPITRAMVPDLYPRLE